MSGVHTPGPWLVFRVKKGPNLGKLLGVGDAQSGGITDYQGGFWRSGAEKEANKAIVTRHAALFRAVIEADTPAACAAADQAFLTAVHATIAEIERDASANAPSLLEAAELALAWFDDVEDDDPAIVRATLRAALAKAKGDDA